MLNRRRQWHPTPVLLTGNPMDRGAWWAAVNGVAKSRTRLSDFPFTFHFHASEKEMATHSSVLAWRIPGTGEPGGLPSLGSNRVRHDWSDLAAAAAVLNCLFFFRMFSSFSFIFNWVLISFSLFCHSSFAWVLTLVLLGCSFLLRFVFLGEGLVQMAFLSSQGALFWSVHVVFRNTAAWLLSSPCCFSLSTLSDFVFLSSLLSLFCSSSGTSPRRFSWFQGPVLGGCPDLRQPSRTSPQGSGPGLVWSDQRPCSFSRCSQRGPCTFPRMCVGYFSG